MGKALEVVGWILIIASLAIALFAGRSTTLGHLVVAAYLFPVIFAGMMIVAFGNMLTQLAALRASSERQEVHLSAIADRLQAPQATGAHGEDWKRPR